MADANPRASGSLTLAFGLVNVGVKYMPIVDPKGGRLSGKYVDPDTLGPLTQQYVNDKGEAVEKVTAYPYDDRMVVLSSSDLQALKSERDGRLELKAFVDPSGVDPLYFEKTHLLWPDKGNETSYDVVCAALAASGKYLVGTAVMDKSTKVIVVRYAGDCLLAHVCAYDSNVRDYERGMVSRTHLSRPAPDSSLVNMAGELFATLDEEFDFASVTDEYDERMRAAVAAAAKGKPMPKAKEVKSAPVADLMEALKASVAAAKEETAKPKRTRKKAPA